jgi:hypothetical protein
MQFSQESFEQGHYTPFFSYKETNETRKLKSDGTGLWFLSKTAVKVASNRKLFFAIKVFSEGDDIDGFNRGLEKATEEGIMSVAYADAIFVKGVGLSVSVDYERVATMTGRFQVNAQFGNETMPIMTAGTALLLGSIDSPIVPPGFSLNVEAVATMRNIDLFTKTVDNGEDLFESENPMYEVKRATPSSSLSLRSIFKI